MLLEKGRKKKTGERGGGGRKSQPRNPCGPHGEGGRVGGLRDVFNAGRREKKKLASGGEKGVLPGTLVDVCKGKWGAPTNPPKLWGGGKGY